MDGKKELLAVWEVDRFDSEQNKLTEEWRGEDDKTNRRRKS